MVYVKWQCAVCGDIKVSNRHRHHQMDICKCKASGLDLEEDYAGQSGSYLFLEEFDYNFFDEIVLCLAQQGFNPLIKIEDNEFITMNTVFFVRKIEDKLLKQLL